MTKKATDSSSREEAEFHTFETHRIPWYVRAGWICFWIFAVWYVVKNVIPMTKNYF